MPVILVLGGQEGLLVCDSLGVHKQILTQKKKRERTSLMFMKMYLKKLTQDCVSIAERCLGGVF